jgi:hypothetical protein
MPRQTSSWLGTWVSFPQLIHRLAASGRARKAAAGHSAKTVNECVLGDTHPVARVAIAGASPAALPRLAEKGRWTLKVSNYCSAGNSPGKACTRGKRNFRNMHRYRNLAEQFYATLIAIGRSLSGLELAEMLAR